MNQFILESLVDLLAYASVIGYEDDVLLLLFDV